MLLNRKNDYEMSEIIIIGEKRKKRKKIIGKLHLLGSKEDVKQMKTNFSPFSLFLISKFGSTLILNLEQTKNLHCFINFIKTAYKKPNFWSNFQKTPTKYYFPRDLKILVFVCYFQKLQEK